jgi:hypothetical protein
MLAQRGTGVELGEALSNASIVFMRFQRRINVAELDRLKALRQPQQTTAETQQLGSFLPTPINPTMGDLEFAQLERFPEQELAHAPVQEPGDPVL